MKWIPLLILGVLIVGLGAMASGVAIVPQDADTKALFLGIYGVLLIILDPKALAASIRGEKTPSAAEDETGKPKV